MSGNQATGAVTLSLSIEGVDKSRLVAFALDGEEAISTLFRFTVSCLLTGGLPLTRAQLGRAAEIRIGTGHDLAPRVIHGLVWELNLADPAPSGEPVYHITILPRLARLTLGRYSQLYGIGAPVSVPDLIEQALSGRLHAGTMTHQAAAAPIAYDLRNLNTYLKRDHVAQYEESDYDFIMRRAERNGMFYFFQPDPATGAERVVFADDNVFTAYADDANKVLHWWHDPGGSQAPPTRCVTQFGQTLQSLPQTVWMREFTESLGGRPNLQRVDVEQGGEGAWTSATTGYDAEWEGRMFALVRAQMLASQAQLCRGASTAEILQAGYLFTLAGHPYTQWNQDFLIVSVHHRCRLPDTATTRATAADTWFGYANTFTAVPKLVIFRPEQRTPWPRVPGLTTGIIEGPSGQREPYLDERGRYRVRLTADLALSPEGAGSTWLRLAEPYAGHENGMHFPLAPGTPVFIACINGDPDRPVIVGAAPPLTENSIVAGPLNWTSRIVSRTGVTVTMGDRRLPSLLK